MRVLAPLPRRLARGCEGSVRGAPHLDVQHRRPLLRMAAVVLQAPLPPPGLLVRCVAVAVPVPVGNVLQHHVRHERGILAQVRGRPDLECACACMHVEVAGVLRLY